MSKIASLLRFLVFLTTVRAMSVYAALNYPGDFGLISSVSEVSDQTFFDGPFSSKITAADILPGSRSNTSFDRNTPFAWDSSQITTLFGFALGQGDGDFFVNPEFQDSYNPRSLDLASDVSQYYDKFLSGGIIYDHAIEARSAGHWAVLAIPEPGQMALAASLGALAFALFSKGKGRGSLARIILRSLLCRLPPNRG